jgi:hypothetical protein
MIPNSIWKTYGIDITNSNIAETTKKMSKYTYILIVHVQERFGLVKSTFCINLVVKCISNMLDCHFFTNFIIGWNTLQIKQHCIMYEIKCLIYAKVLF